MSEMIRLDILAEDAECDAVQGVILQHISYGWEEESLPTGETRFRVHCEQPELLADLKAGIQYFAPQASMEQSVLKNTDWQAAWKEFFTPVPCGRFVVLPPWLLDSTPLNDAQPIVIEPKSAFGTGHHNTTVLCLTALSQLFDEGRLHTGMRFFDLGTGSGVLGIGCALNGLTGIGSDIDPLAVDNAQENAAINHVDNAFTIRTGSTETAGTETFDCVVANILAGPLRELAPEVLKCLKSNGVLVLSGILAIQGDAVADAYQTLGTPERMYSGDWVALIWK